MQPFKMEGMARMVNLNNKSIIVVGCAGSLKNSNLGKKIDEFDIVIRINKGYTKGYEKDVGSKNTIWVSYDSINLPLSLNRRFEYYHGLNTDEIKELVKSVKEIWYLSFNKSDLDRTKEDDLIEYLGLSIPTKTLNERYRNKLNAIHHKPSTGLITILLLLLLVDKFYITGFTINDNNSSEYWHYFSKFKGQPKYNNTQHNWYIERQYIKKLINENKVINLTNESKIEKSKLSSKPKIFKCSNCNMNNYIYKWEVMKCNYCDGEL
ncbi:MAG: hypothetical protein GF350_02605 [Chitinivibrionales bacterium]|nr:hypothetical protein [Chitinivibrionales bacterium]